MNNRITVKAHHQGPKDSKISLNTEAMTWNTDGDWMHAESDAYPRATFSEIGGFILTFRGEQYRPATGPNIFD